MNKLKKGFTLVELLAVIVILGVVVSISVPVVKNVIKSSKIKLGLSNAKMIYNKINSYCDTEEVHENVENYETICNSKMDVESVKKIVNLGKTKINDIAYGNNSLLNLEIESNGNNYILYKGNMINEEELKSTDLKCFDIQVRNGLKTIVRYDVNCGGTDVVIPEGVEVINGLNRKKLTSVRLPKSLKRINNSAFIDNNLKYVNIPEGVEYIDSMAFQRNKLENIKLPTTLTTIQDGAFASNQLTNIFIPPTVKILDGGAFADNLLEGDSVFIYGLNADGIIDKSILNSYAGKDRENVTVPSNIKTISSNAFWDEKIKNITLPEGLIRIELGAFRGNDLNEIVIPSTVEAIEYISLYRNPSLRKVINKTGRAFDWNSIILDKTSTPFVTGTVEGVTITDK